MRSNYVWNTRKLLVTYEHKTWICFEQLGDILSSATQTHKLIG